MKRLYLSLLAIVACAATMLAGQVVYDFSNPTDGLYGLTLTDQTSGHWQTLPHTMTSGPVSVVLSQAGAVNPNGGFKLYDDGTVKGLYFVSGAGALNAAVPKTVMTISASTGNVKGVTVELADASKTGSVKVSFSDTYALTTAVDGRYSWSGDAASVPVYLATTVGKICIKSITVDFEGEMAGPVEPELKDPELSFDVEEYTYYIRETVNDPFPKLNNPYGVSVTYTSSDPSVASYRYIPQANAGFFSGLKEGECIFTVTSAATDEYAAGEVTLRVIVKNERAQEPVEPELKDPELSFDVEEYTYYISEFDNDLFPTLNNPHGVAVTYTSSDPDVAWYMTFGSDGFFIGQKEGECVFTVTSEATDEYAAGEATLKIIVKNKRVGENTVVFPTTLDVTSDATSGEFSCNNDFGLPMATGVLNTEGTSVNVTVATPEGWTGVYYVAPSSDNTATSLAAGAAPTAITDYDENSEWVSEQYMRSKYSGVKGNTFTVLADGQNYEYSIYFVDESKGEACVYVASHAMVSVTAFPPFEAPENLVVTCEELPELEFVYESASDDYGFPMIAATATVLDNDPEFLTFNFDLPAGWTAMYHSPVVNMSAEPMSAKIRKAVAASTVDDFEWEDEASLEEAGYERSRTFSISTLEPGMYMVQIYLAKDGQVAVSNPYGFQLNLATEEPAKEYVSKEYSLVIGGMNYPMYFEGTDENGAGVYTALVDRVDANDTVVVSDGEEFVYTVASDLVLNADYETYLEPLEDGAEPGRMAGSGVNVTFTFNDNPNWTSYSLKADGTEVNQYSEWVLVTENGMFNLELQSDTNEEYIYTADIPLLTKDTKFYIKNTKDGKYYSSNGEVALNSEYDTYLFWTEEEQWMHLDKDAENVVVTFDNNVGWEMMYLKVSGNEAGESTEWVLVLNGENVSFKVKEADLANENYTYEVALSSLKDSDNFYILNKVTGLYYSTNGTVTVNAEYPASLFWGDNANEIEVMSVAANYDDVTFTFNNNVGWETMTLSVAGKLQVEGGVKYYLKGNVANNGNGDWDAAPGVDVFKQVGESENLLAFGPVDFGAFKSFTIWGGENNAWHSAASADPGFLSYTLAAEVHHNLYENEADYYMAPEEQGRYWVVLNFTDPDNRKIALTDTDPALHLDDFATGVAGVEAANGDAVYYDLTGNKVVNPAKGVYVKVVNGKASRVLIK